MKPGNWKYFRPELARLDSVDIKANQQLTARGGAGDSHYLYQGLPGVGGDHGLELASGEGVDVACLRGHQ